MTEIKETKLSDGSIVYDLQITTDHVRDPQIAIACIYEQHAIDLKALLDDTVSIELM